MLEYRIRLKWSHLSQGGTPPGLWRPNILGSRSVFLRVVLIRIVLTGAFSWVVFKLEVFRLDHGLRSHYVFIFNYQAEWHVGLISCLTVSANFLYLAFMTDVLFNFMEGRDDLACFFVVRDRVNPIQQRGVEVISWDCCHHLIIALAFNCSSKSNLNLWKQSSIN